MAKGNILSDSFEQLAELGQSTAKQGGKQIAQTFSPLKLIDQLTGKTQDNSPNPEEQNTRLSKTEDNKSTPLDLNKLQQKYQNQEKTKVEELKHRLFQMVKREDEKSLQRKKAEEKQKKQEEEAKEEQKKRRQLKEAQEQQLAEEPQGKIRQSIFSRKKKKPAKTIETKPSAGKH